MSLLSRWYVYDCLPSWLNHMQVKKKTNYFWITCSMPVMIFCGLKPSWNRSEPTPTVVAWQSREEFNIMHRQRVSLDLIRKNGRKTKWWKDILHQNFWKYGCQTFCWWNLAMVKTWQLSRPICGTSTYKIRTSLTKRCVTVWHQRQMICYACLDFTLL